MQTAGQFDVTLKPLEPFEQGRAGFDSGGWRFEKVFRGDLDAESRNHGRVTPPPPAGAVPLLLRPRRGLLRLPLKKESTGRPLRF